jgi:cytoskeletal protein CcmA (bactofilin family)
MWTFSDSNPPKSTMPSAVDTQATIPVRDAALVAAQETTIGKSLVIKGEITGSEPVYIDGCVEGSLGFPARSVTIGPNGKVKASISAREVVVIGNVCGDLNLSDRVEIRSSGSLMGDVVAQRISMEDGAFFKGRVDVCKLSENGDRGPQTEPAVSSEAARLSSVAAAR